MSAGDYAGQKVLNSGELQLKALGDISQVYGNTVTKLTRPSGATSLWLDCESGYFRVKKGDFSVVGSDVVTNGAFATDTDWTKGTGWTIGSGVGSSDGTQGADSDLEQTLTATLVEGEFYEVSFTVTAYTAGNVTPVVGGTEGTDRSSAASFTEVIQAGATQVIALRADLNFIGSVDNFTVKRATLQLAPPTVSRTDGECGRKIRADAAPEAFAAPDYVTVIGSAADAVLVYQWQ